MTAYATTLKDLRECHSRRPVLLVRCWAVEQGPGGGGRRSRLKPENVAGAHAGRTWEQDLSPSPEGASSPGSSREVEEAQAALARSIEGEYLGSTPRRKFLCSRRERWGEGWWGGGGKDESAHHAHFKRENFGPGCAIGICRNSFTRSRKFLWF